MNTETNEMKAETLQVISGIKVGTGLIGGTFLADFYPVVGALALVTLMLLGIATHVVVVIRDIETPESHGIEENNRRCSQERATQ